jgi:ABC-type transport system involved in cytochrome c biogenesis permease component
MAKTPQDVVRRAKIVKAWRNFFIALVLMFPLIMLAMDKLSSGLTVSILAVLLAAMLLYQRFVNKRSWRSIMWGVHVSGE